MTTRMRHALGRQAHALPHAHTRARTRTRMHSRTHTRSSACRRPLTIAAIAILIATLTSACGSAPVPAYTTTTVQAAAPLPGGVATQPPGPSVSLDGCDASLSPTGPLPSPGAMPAGSTMAKIEQRGYLIAGVDDDTYLFGYRNPSADPAAPPVVGFDIDIVRQISQAIFGSPDRVRYKILPTADRITAVQNGTVDLVADTLTIDCQRAQQIDFSSDYFDAGQRLLVDQSSTVQDLADLAGKKVCAASGTTSVQNLANSPYHVTAVSAVSWADCLVMLQQGEVDAVSTTDLILLGLQLQDPYTKIVGPRFTFERHGIGIPTGDPDLVRFVNGVLQNLRTDGTWTQLYTEWIGTRLGPVPTPPPAVYQ